MGRNVQACPEHLHGFAGSEQGVLFHIIPVFALCPALCESLAQHSFYQARHSSSSF